MPSLPHKESPMHSTRAPLAVAAAVGILLVGCSTDNTGPANETFVPRMALTGTGAANSYVLQGGNNKLPANLASLVSKAGGTLTGSSPQIGVAYATSSDPAFQSKAATITGIQTADQDRLVRGVDPEDRVEEAGEVSGATGVTGAGLASPASAPTARRAP